MENNNTIYKLAGLLSAIFNPFVTGLTALVTIVGTSRLPVQTLILTLLFIIFVVTGIPLALLTLAIRYKKVSNFDITDRRERKVPLAILSVLMFVDAFFLNLIAGAEISRYLVVFGLTIIGFSFITNYWKLSGHTAIATLSFLVIFDKLGQAWWLLFAAIPLVAWSRVYKQDHTPMQVVAGILYSVIIFLGYRSIIL